MPLLLALVNGKINCDQLTDKELVDMLMGGEPGRSQALQCLIKMYKKGYSGSMMNKHSILSREDIEDCFFVAINELYQYIATGRYFGQAKVSTLFFTIFNRRCIDLGRSRSNKGENDGEFPVNISDPNPDPLETVSRNEDKDNLMSAMDKLSAKCRNILIDWMEGYSMKEIAERNGLANANTAKSTKSNCLRSLRNIL